MIQDRLSDEARSFYNQEVDDHRNMLARLSELEVWLDSCGRTGIWAQTLAGTLTDIVEGLKPHFAREEASPLFAEVPTSFPRFANMLDRLMGEHMQLVEDIERIIDALENIPALSEQRIEEICCKTKLVIATLRRHESEENEILQRAYCEDIGACD